MGNLRASQAVLKEREQGTYTRALEQVITPVWRPEHGRRVHTDMGPEPQGSVALARHRQQRQQQREQWVLLVSQRGRRVG